jgi:hypothetical protein
MVKNFLWSRKYGHHSRAKVTWLVIALPTSQCGLRLVNPLHQCKALFGKLIVRSFLSGKATWKQLFESTLHACKPQTGCPWEPHARWIFRPNWRFTCSNKWEDKFIQGIYRSWKQLQSHLFQKPLSIQEEKDRQPLIWNPMFRATLDHMLGEHSRLM